MTFIQNRMAKTLSVRVSAFVAMAVSGEADRGAEHDEASRVEGAGARPQDDEHAEEPEADGDETPDSHGLAQEQHREERDPGRRGEFEGEDRGEGQEREAERPAIGAAEMRRRCARGEAPCGAAGGAAAAPARRSAAASEHGDRGGVAQGEDLEHREGRRKRPGGDRGRREAEERAAHPEDGGEDVAMGHRRVSGHARRWRRPPVRPRAQRAARRPPKPQPPGPHGGAARILEIGDHPAGQQHEDPGDEGDDGRNARCAGGSTPLRNLEPNRAWK